MVVAINSTEQDGIVPVRQRLHEMLAIESAIETQLRAGLAAVAGHAATAAAFEQLAEAARQRQDALREIDGEGRAIDADATGETVQPADASAASEAEAALRSMAALLHEAVLGYAALHQTAHVFHTGHLGGVLRLAAQHLRTCAAAAREIDQVLPDVVAWELRRDGQRCVCPCPYCSLGVCWCIADSTDTVSAAWRDAAPPTDGLRVARNARATPDLALADGDVVVAVNGAPVASLADVRLAAPSPAPGTKVLLTVRRLSGAVCGVLASRS